MPSPLEHPSQVERDCVARYVSLVSGRLPDASEVWLLGSAARGDMWPARIEWPLDG